MSETIESNTFGTLFHAVMESVYKPYKGQIVTKEIIKELIQGTISLDNYIHAAFNKTFYKNKTNMPLLGENLLIANIIKAYVIQTLQFDQRMRAPFLYLDTELSLTTALTLENGLSVNLKGIIDRVDEQQNVTHIVDYKTGKASTEFQNIDDLFDSTKDKRPKAVLQTFFYAMLYQLNCKTAKQLKPSIYSLRDLENYQIKFSLSKNETTIIDDYNNFKESFETGLTNCLSDIFDSEKPFTQCTDTKLCEYCHFKNLCNR